MRFFFSSLLLVACSSSPPPPPPVVDPPVIACTPPSDAGACDPFSTDAGTCDAGAAYANPCELPPSVCADSHWAAYFDNGTCGANGQCELVTQYHYCDSGCQGGACISTGPTFAGRGF